MTTITTMTASRVGPPGSDDTSGLLVALQLGDSFFPSGGSAFSWGLESLRVDGRVAGVDQVRELLCDLLASRWAGFDRPLTRAAHRISAAQFDEADAATPALLAVDGLCEAMTLCSGGRSASRRLGFTQLRVHGELGLAAASSYLRAVRAERAHGHLAIVQGLVWQASGLNLRQTETLAAFGYCTAVVSAAIRLGALGHLDAQRVLCGARLVIETTLDIEPPDLDDMWSGTPAIDVALLRHESRVGRLFAN